MKNAVTILKNCTNWKAYSKYFNSTWKRGGFWRKISYITNKYTKPICKM